MAAGTQRVGPGLALHRHVATVREDALGLVVAPVLGIVADPSRLQIDAHDLAASVRIGREDELALVRRTEVLGLEEGEVVEVAPVQNLPAVHELRRFAIQRDLSGPDLGAGEDDTIGILGPRPRDAEAVSSDGRALEALLAEWHGGAVQTRAQEPEIRVPAAALRLLGRSGPRPAEEHVAVRQIASSAVAAVRVVLRQRSHAARFELEFEHVADQGVEKEKTCPVGRPVGPHAGLRQSNDVGRQVVDRRARPACGGIGGAAAAERAQKKRPERSDQAEGEPWVALPVLHGWQDGMATGRLLQRCSAAGRSPCDRGRWPVPHWGLPETPHATPTAGRLPGGESRPRPRERLRAGPDQPEQQQRQATRR